MSRELYKFITTGVCELLFAGPTLVFPSHPPVVLLLFLLLRADGNGNGAGGGELFLEAERVSAEFIFGNYRVLYCKFRKPELIFLA